MSIQRLDEIRMVDPVLTTLTQGYSNNQFIAERIFPLITVANSKGKFPIFGKEAFIDRDTDRALRAKSNRINASDFVLDEYETTERDIETAIDYLETEEAHNYYRYEQKICKDLRDILNLSREKEVADYIQNSENYISDMKRVLTEDERINSFVSPSNPIDLIRTAKESIRSKISKYPNTMIMGISVFNELRNNSFVKNYIGDSGSLITADFIKEIFEINDLYVGYSVCSPDGISMQDIWMDNIILSYVDKSENNSKSEYNPSFGYIFQREGMPEIDTYSENGGKVKVIRCTDNFCWKITAPEAGYLISNII